MTKRDIIEAYSVYWKYVEPHVDENGWAKTSETGLIDAYYEHQVSDIEFEKYPLRRWRPLMLKDKENGKT